MKNNIIMLLLASYLFLMWGNSVEIRQNRDKLDYIIGEMNCIEKEELVNPAIGVVPMKPTVEEMTREVKQINLKRFLRKELK